MSVRVAAIQMCSGADREANLVAAATFLEEAARAGATLAVLPENFSFLAARDADRLWAAEPAGDGPAQAFLAVQAARLGLWIVGGTVPLLDPGSERPAAACLLLDALGRLVARYDKIHLFDVDIPGTDEGYRESAATSAGCRAVVADSPLGRLGLGVCYDVRFPELFRAQTAAGMDCIALPSAFTVPTGRAHWELLVRARAVENLCAVVAAAQWGVHDGGRRTWGDSMIVDHWGNVLARRYEGAGVVLADVDPAAQSAARRRFPALAHRLPPGSLLPPKKETQ